MTLLNYIVLYAPPPLACMHVNINNARRVIHEAWPTPAALFEAYRGNCADDEEEEEEEEGEAGAAEGGKNSRRNNSASGSGSGSKSSSKAARIAMVEGLQTVAPKSGAKRKLGKQAAENLHSMFHG
jgi:hypothetical protein